MASSVPDETVTSLRGCSLVSLGRTLACVAAVCHWEMTAFAQDPVTDNPVVTQQQAIAAITAREEARALADLKDSPEPQKDDPERITVWSRRGDALMFLGRFDEAEAAYRQMVVEDPAQDASHWRLGIACFFAGSFDKGASQFDKYHSFDNVDRENGIWRYFCHFRASGRKAAREQLLKYEKDDRPPFREVYSLFEGRMTAEQVMEMAAGGSAATKAQRQFYSALYVGLNASLYGDRDLAIESLTTATLSNWPQRAGYGPSYMWHVGRLELIRQQRQPAAR